MGQVIYPPGLTQNRNTTTTASRSVFALLGGSAKKTAKPDLEKSCIDRFMGWYGQLFMKPAITLVVVLAFLGATAGFAYSTTLFKQEFNFLEMLPKDSYVKEYLVSMEKHGERGWIIPSVYFRGVDQSDPEVQQQMEDYINDLVEMNAMSDQPPYFWLRHFKQFLEYDDRLKEYDFTTQVAVFLNIPAFKSLYGDHIIRDPDTKEVIASRCVVYMDNVDLNDVNSQIQTWTEQWNITESQPINAKGADSEGLHFFLYETTMLYVWEFYAQTVNELTMTTILGVATVSFIGFIFIPHWTAICFLFPIIAALYIDLIGTSTSCRVFSTFHLKSENVKSLLTACSSYHYRIHPVVWGPFECSQLLYSCHVNWTVG